MLPPHPTPPRKDEVRCASGSSFLGLYFQTNPPSALVTCRKHSIATGYMQQGCKTIVSPSQYTARFTFSASKITEVPVLSRSRAAGTCNRTMHNVLHLARNNQHPSKCQECNGKEANEAGSVLGYDSNNMNIDCNSPFRE